VKSGNVYKILLVIGLSSLTLLLPTKLLSADSDSSKVVSDKKLFAVVNGYEIFEQEFLIALRNKAKKQFYHGNITPDRLAQLKEEVTRDLIDSVLLTQEAKRRELVPDEEKIQLELKQFDERYANDSGWQRDKETFLPVLRQQLESRELLAMLESSVRSDILITEPLKKQFYADNPDVFVFPVRNKVSLILIKVSPSALSEEWDRVHSLMDSIATRILAGESFADLAKEFSVDSTASKGGDMGYQHKGTLHADVEKVIEGLKVGELSKPIRILEGYVLLKLEDVIPEQKINYADSEKQLVELLSRKLSDEKWQALLDKLRSNASIVTEF